MPPYLEEHPALHALYQGLAATLAPTLLGAHADQLAFRAVLHAIAWHGEPQQLNAYYATETQGHLLYHCTSPPNPDPLSALDVHLAALLDHTGTSQTGLSRSGTAIWIDLNHHENVHTLDPRLRPHTGPSTSSWRITLQLLTRYGLNFDAHLTSDEDAA